MNLPVAELIYRECGSYPKSEHCLVCGMPVDTRSPHIFVRDADATLDDRAALVGLLHVGCEPRFIENAKASGI